MSPLMTYTSSPILGKRKSQDDHIYHRRRSATPDTTTTTPTLVDDTSWTTALLSGLLAPMDNKQLDLPLFDDALLDYPVSTPPSAVIPEEYFMGDEWMSMMFNRKEDEGEEDMTLASSPSSDASSVMLNGRTTGEQKLVDDIRQQLESEATDAWCTIMILTSKVAQKSYGSEKRFLCPPPTTLLMGAGWQHAVRLNIATNDSPQPHTDSGVPVDWHMEDMVGKVVSKQLHVHEKKKQVHVSVSAHLPSGDCIGSFASKDIKVISKPSKKRQTKHTELCIPQGSTISLFNRIRSQTVSTKYLGVRGGSFVVRPGAWDPFMIWALDASPASVIQYNQRVVLQCGELVSPVLVTRRIDKGGKITTSGQNEPVTQLHRMAFELENGAGYLTCLNDAVVFGERGDAHEDTAIWTLIGTECATYSFYCPPDVHTLTPFPRVEQMRIVDHALLCLDGVNLQGLTVWLGSQRCMTTNTDDGVCALIPNLFNDTALTSSTVHPTTAIPATTPTTTTSTITDPAAAVPVLLARESDGVVYRTDHFYTPL